jgi:hypothetical protein
VPTSLAVLSTLSSFCEGSLRLLRCSVWGDLATVALLCLGGLATAALLCLGGLATAALLGVGKNLLLHYGRLRCAFRYTSLWRLNSFPGNASEVPRLDLCLRIGAAAVTGSALVASKVGRVRTDALQVRKRNFPTPINA